MGGQIIYQAVFTGLYEICPEGIQPGSKKNKAFIEEDRRCNKQYT